MEKHKTLAREQVADFLDRYRAFSSQLTDSRLQRFHSGFDRLRATLTTLRAEADERNKRLAGDFNVFRLLGVAYNEVSTHSALLADLFDPQGTHGQKHLFLDGFFRMCRGKFANFPLPAADITLGRWVVEKEKVTPSGTMDLVVSCLALKFLLVIENKIWASEQPDQLRRYYEWMQGRKGRFADRALIYLTPTGVQSDTSTGCLYFPLSYHDDIRTWLEASLPYVQAPRVRETIGQYLEIIKEL